MARSDGPSDIGAIGAAFGGGGHRFMSGFTTADPVEQVINKLSNCFCEWATVATPDPVS